MISKGHWTEQATNAIIVHHFSKPTTDPASPDSTGAPANDATNEEASSTLLDS